VEVSARLLQAREAARILRTLGAEHRRRGVRSMAEALRASRLDILEANHRDLEAGAVLPASLKDRLRLDEHRLDAIAAMMSEVSALPDPLTHSVDGMRTIRGGLEVGRQRVPLGVIAVVYEARPNVTAECAALGLMSGNAIVLRGGKEAARSNAAIGTALLRGLEDADLPSDAVQVWSEARHAEVEALLGATGLVDLVIPRGGARLMALVDAKARVPVIRHGQGIVHVFIDAAADAERALRIVFDAKVDRPGVCNAMETLLVHRDRLGMLEHIARTLSTAGVELRADGRSREVLSAAGVPSLPAAERDWDTEYLDLVVAIRVVDDLTQALEHIERHGTHHTAAIVTEDASAAERFLAEVDASCVLWNASTRFNDGHQLGLGAEIGISTSKMHAYGPMGLVALTSEKFIVKGAGHARGAGQREDLGLEPG